jgi:mitochondrial Rho GTPase 1
VQPVLPVVVVPEDATPERVHVSIVDTPGGAAGMLTVDEGLASANVVVLVYSVDDEKSIQRVRTFWLEKFRYLKLNVPIILAGNKIDLRGGVDNPKAAENMEEFIKPIMDEYREVEVCIECSAKTVSNIPEVFYFAQKAVLHPTGPLYDVDTQSLTDGASAALRRVFAICDRDKDGALNDKELNDFQFQCFNIHLAPDELEGVKKVVMESRPTNGLTQEGYLSVDGFLLCRRVVWKLPGLCSESLATLMICT